MSIRDQHSPGSQDALPAHSVRVCRGAQQCKHAVAPGYDPTEMLTEQVLAAGWPEFIARRVQPLRHHHQFRLAYAACANGCSQPHIADMGLLAFAPIAVQPELCSACGACVKVCAEQALRIDDTVHLDTARCLGCAACARVCPTGALVATEPVYRVVLGGKLGRHPRLAHELGLFSLPESLTVLTKTLDLYMTHYRPGLRLGALVETLGQDQFDSLVRP